jgi:predicted acetyltransferase
MLAYAPGRDQLERYQTDLRTDPRPGTRDFLLAEHDGAAIGTATSLSLTMYVRGAPVRCQGVASVGTAKTHRRKTRQGPGVGSQLMQEVLRRAREQEYVVSALMPFRVSFYETFGYGLIERKKEWTIPLDLIGRGEFGSIRYFREEDFDELINCRHRIAQSNQCDVDRPPEVWRQYMDYFNTGFFVVDRPAGAAVRGWMTIEHASSADGIDTVRAFWDFGWQDIATLKRFLYFLGSLRDQYRYASVHLPADFPLNLLLKEKQLTHRPSKNHPNATERHYTRMQVRVLDHKKFLEAMKLPERAAGRAVVAVHEESGPSKFEVEFSGGGASVKKTDASPDIECGPADWAIIACGDVKASLAAELGLVQINRAAALSDLDILGEGPPPYCREYF